MKRDAEVARANEEAAILAGVGGILDTLDDDARQRLISHIVERYAWRPERRARAITADARKRLEETAEAAITMTSAMLHQLEREHQHQVIARLAERFGWEPPVV